MPHNFTPFGSCDLMNKRVFPPYKKNNIPVHGFKTQELTRRSRIKNQTFITLNFYKQKTTALISKPM